MHELPLNNGETWSPTDEEIIEWQRLYGAVDVFQELNGMRGWLDANPTKRKTPRGIKRFVNSWLSRAQNQGGSPQAQESTKSGKVERTRDMTALDDLTHIFIDGIGLENVYLEKYGQYFKDGERVTK